MEVVKSILLIKGDRMALKEKLITVVVSEDIHGKLLQRRTRTGASIQFQVNEALTSYLEKKSASRAA
jgi:hypothetical protein